MNVIEEACKYAQRGWKVFPLISGSKKPIDKGGFHNATDDIEAICTWDTKCNLGVATGSVSGFWVLDLDNKNDKNGVDSLKKLMDKHQCTSFNTLISQTPSGGYHYFFKMPDFELRNGVNILSGVDIRANGGYIVAPPSLLDNGVYVWKNNSEINYAPSWLYEELSKKKNSESTKVTLQEGSRNNDLFKIASSLRGRGLNSDQIYILLLEENHKCKPEPLDIQEVKTIAYSAGQRYKTNPEYQDQNTEPFDANGRSPGQLAMEILFSDGIYISVNDELFEYKNGYYQKIDEGAVSKKISDLFDRCITSKSGQHGYARTQHVKEALNHVKAKFYVPYHKTKPRGLCLKNGIIKPKYTNDGKVKFDLHPHTPDEFFLFQADFDYKPDLDSAELNRLFDAMLDPEAQTALLRNISSVIDMNVIRAKHTRALRALILEGEGSNGKDSLRTWCQMLLGQAAFSNIPVGVFKRADSQREFQLSSLAYSRINWCSESQKVQMDNCQIIKQIITGDPVILEQKHKEPFTIEPEIVMIFNANASPAFEELSEAMQSRYAIITFPYVFKDNPNPNLSHERKADSRLKYEPEFLKNYVLPAFLNRLLLEYQLLYSEGVDYSFQESTIHEVRRSHNHLFDFLEDMDLVECEAKDQGLAVKEFYKMYVTWCEKEGYITTSPFGDVVKYNNPNEQYDKVLTNPMQLSKKLRKIKPRLDFARTADSRYIGLQVKKIVYDPFA